MPKRQDPHQQLLALLSEVMAVARALSPAAMPAARKTKPTTKAAGVYPHQSKYNPWRAYVWDTRTRKSVYLGAFPSMVKARAAQKAYRDGGTVRNGTKAGPRLVAAA